MFPRNAPPRSWVGISCDDGRREGVGKFRRWLGTPLQGGKGAEVASEATSKSCTHKKIENHNNTATIVRVVKDSIRCLSV